MKKLLGIVLITSLLLLVACGSKDSSNDTNVKGNVTPIEENGENNSSDGKQTEPTGEQDNNESEKNVEEFNEDTGEGYIEDMGYVKTVGIGYSDELGIDGTDAPLNPIVMGDMELIIESLAVAEIEPDDDAKELFFDGEEKVKVIIVDMKTENKSDKDIEFHPDNSILVTSTGEQLESDMFMSSEVGGEFFGKVKKEGQTWWTLKDPTSDITGAKIIIRPAYGIDDWDDIGEEKRVEFEIVSFEEALKRDSK